MLCWALRTYVPQPADPLLAFCACQAIRKNDLDTVAGVLVQEPELLAAKGEFQNEGGSWTPLGLAARLGYADMVR